MNNTAIWPSVFPEFTPLAPLVQTLGPLRCSPSLNEAGKYSPAGDWRQTGRQQRTDNHYKGISIFVGYLGYAVCSKHKRLPFPAGVNTSDTENLPQCGAYLNGQILVNSGADSSEIFMSESSLFHIASQQHF